MTKARAERPTFSFTKGINTDASPMTFPLNYTVDEENFDLLVDGTRRRRLGLAADSSSVTNVNVGTTEVVRSFKWSNVGGDPLKNFQVIQTGFQLLFYLDQHPIGSAEQTFAIDLRSVKVSGSSDSEVASSAVDTAFGRGHLFVVGQYIEPFYVTYDSATNSIQVNGIAIRERDFEGVSDGVDNVTTPTTLPAAMRYNLLNSGWKGTDIDAFRTANSVYPAKNMLYSLGYRRTVVAGIAEEDGTKEFSPAKLIEELFQDAPAPKGHFIRDPFDTSSVVVTEPVGVSIPYSSMTVSPVAPGATTITVTTPSAHGLAVGANVAINGTDLQPATILYHSSYSGTINTVWVYGGLIASVPTSTTLTIAFDLPEDFLSVYSYPTGYLVSSTNTIANTEGFVSPYRPVTTAFFAGRIWFAGVNYNRLASKVYFSQVIESDTQYGRCYQLTDPTDANISDILPTDGGVLSIPEMAQVYKILPYSSGLLIFAANGVWQIGPGATGYFTATSYSVRKVSDVGPDGPGSIVIAETVPVYWGKSAVYSITQDPNQGFLVSQSISSGIIDTLFNAITDDSKAAVQSTYDPLYKRIMWLYTDDGSPATRYNKILLFDLRYQAFIKWSVTTTPNAIVSLFCLKNADSASPNNHIKIVADAGTTLTFNGFTDTSFVDWGSASYSSYIVTGYDTANSPTRYKYAPIIHVFTKKTETGYTEVSGQLAPIRAGGLLMQARWNWADHINAGKWGTSQQCYRHRRLYIPTSSADTFNTGEPVIVTRNKVRGRGRSLHLLFSSQAGKDAHILGWAINYDALTDN